MTSVARFVLFGALAISLSSISFFAGSLKRDCQTASVSSTISSLPALTVHVDHTHHVDAKSKADGNFFGFNFSGTSEHVRAYLTRDLLGLSEGLDFSGLNVIYQLPLKLQNVHGTASTVENAGSAKEKLSKQEMERILQHRVEEYVKAARITLQHPAVSCVHFLTESVPEQLYIYSLFNASVLHKVRTYTLNKRMSFADAVIYANKFLQGRIAMLSTADTSVVGDSWNHLKVKHVEGKLMGLSRHEQKGCAMSCDCLLHFDGCHDTFIFVPPLAGGDLLLEQISFRVGGLWGSENRFLWEVKAYNPKLDVINPCQTLRMEHTHCVSAGNFRPSQEQRRVNINGKSLAPGPVVLDLN